jgi:hypothetical protein
MKPIFMTFSIGCLYMNNANRNFWSTENCDFLPARRAQPLNRRARRVRSTVYPIAIFGQSIFAIYHIGKMPEKFVQIAQKKFSKTLDKSFGIVYNDYSE